MASRLPGTPPILSGFHYVQALGAGGFADVFLFEQQMPRRSVAVKVMLKNVVDEHLLHMFQAEADAMAQMSAHPSIVTIYEASISADGRPYLVMEYCPDSYAKKFRTQVIPVQEVLNLGIKIGSALEMAHRAGMLHRDVKPSNLLITKYGAPVLSDFGIVSGFSEDDEDSYVAMSIPWSAPEIVSEQETGNVQSEVWSLAATLYTLLAGQSPFELPGRGQNAKELLRARIMKAQYKPLRRPDIPERLQATLKKAMSRKPSERHESIAHFAYELQLAQTEMGIPFTPLEIEQSEWFQSATQNSAEYRGPVRSVVPSKRRKVGDTENLINKVSEIPGGDDVRPGVQMKSVILITLAAIVATAGVSTLIFALMGR